MNPNASLTRTLPLSYRQPEIILIARCLRAGDSCAVISVSGMAKSNLFRHLLTPEVRQHYLGDNWQSYLFLAADAHALGEVSERAAYSLFIELLMAEARLQNVAESVISRVEQLSQPAALASDPLLWQRAFVQAVQAIMTADAARHLVILFDQFDEVYKTLNPHFFANLRALRDQHKYRLSYVVFTREELPALASAPEHEEFYELFSPHVLGLGPYSPTDARLLLARVSGRFGQRLEAQVEERLITLTGGHPGLLKAACLALLNHKTSLPEGDEQAIAALLAVDDLRTECAKLWGSIQSDEQEALRRLAMGGVTEISDQNMARRLRLKHLLTDRDGATRPFCPLFSQYLAEQKLIRPADIRIKAGPIRIDTDGEVWINERQVVPPLPPMELKLLAFLCQEPGHLRSKDEVIAALYPHLYKIGEAPTDDALTAVLTRLRNSLKKISATDDLIETVRGKGYRLNVG